jgi:hypothetical protein
VKLHNEELYNFYSSPCIIRMIKSRRMSWEGHVARMGGGRGMHIGGKARWKEATRSTKMWVDNIKTDLKSERMGWYGLDRTGSVLGPVEGSCEHDNERSGSIKCWEVLE